MSLPSPSLHALMGLRSSCVLASSAHYHPSPSPSPSILRSPSLSYSCIQSSAYSSLSSLSSHHYSSHFPSISISPFRCFNVAAAAPSLSPSPSSPPSSLPATPHFHIDGGQFDRVSSLSRFYCPPNPKYFAELRRRKSLTHYQSLHDAIGKEVSYRRHLRVVGVGYKFSLVDEKKLSVSVGYSHAVHMDIPKGMLVSFSKKNRLVRLQHPSIHLVTQMASAIRRVKKPDPYKGKGVRYRKEAVRLKPKSAKKK